MATYYCILTTLGLIKFAAAALPGGDPVVFAQAAVGDGNGAHYQPDEEQIALLNETWRGPVNRVYGDPLNAHRFIIEALIPADVGGWTIRELGLLDDAGGLLAVGIYPETDKPAPGSGSEKDIYVRMVLQVSNGGELVQVINSDLVMATQAYVDQHAGRIEAHGATVEATGGHMLIRNAGGQTSVADGTTASHAVNKGQLDAETLARVEADNILAAVMGGKEPAFNKNTAFNKNFGSAAGTVCEGNDTRLSNRREWIAATVSQSEAKAGTATTRRAWTAQRVAQAVIAKLVGLGTGAVGTYALLAATNYSAAISAGSLYAGSSLRYAGFRVRSNRADWNFVVSGGYAGTPSGTWRAMGAAILGNWSAYYPATLFLRVA